MNTCAIHVGVFTIHNKMEHDTWRLCQKLTIRQQLILTSKCHLVRLIITFANNTLILINVIITENPVYDYDILTFGNSTSYHIYLINLMWSTVPGDMTFTLEINNNGFLLFWNNEELQITLWFNLSPFKLKIEEVHYDWVISSNIIIEYIYLSFANILQKLNENGNEEEDNNE